MTEYMGSGTIAIATIPERRIRIGDFAEFKRGQGILKAARAGPD